MSPTFHCPKLTTSLHQLTVQKSHLGSPKMMRDLKMIIRRSQRKRKIMKMAISINLEKTKNWNRLEIERVRELGNAYLYLFFRQLRNKNADLNYKRSPLMHWSMNMSRRLRHSRRNTTRHYKKVICIKCFKNDNFLLVCREKPLPY